MGSGGGGLGFTEKSRRRERRLSAGGVLQYDNNNKKTPTMKVLHHLPLPLLPPVTISNSTGRGNESPIRTPKPHMFTIVCE